MGVSSGVKTDFVWKKIKGRRYTTADKAWYEEKPGRLVFPHYTEVWGDDIPVPAPGATTSVVQYYSDLQLTEDTSVANHRAWLACETVGDPSTQLKGFVPPRFDQSYTVRVYEDDGSGNKGSEVPTTHPSNWFFDYENGVLVFENDPTSYGLQTPFHIEVYRYIGSTGGGGGGGSVSEKKQAFLREATNITVSTGSSSVDVTSYMSGKTPGGSETSTGVVTTAPYNRCPILTYPDRDEIVTADGNKVYGRLTESSGVWTLSFYYMAEDGTETPYTFSADTDIIWGYYEVFNFPDWPVFDDDAVLPSDQVVGDIPYATTAAAGKVRLADDNETDANEVLRADDPRAKKATDFAIHYSNSSLDVTIDPGVYNNKGDSTSSTNLTLTASSTNYIYVKRDGTVTFNTTGFDSDADLLIALYTATTDGTGVTNVVDVRPIYSGGSGVGDATGDGTLGVPPDGTYADGLLDFQPTDKVNYAIDEMNEVLKYLAPEDADPLAGSIDWNTTFKTGKISDGLTLNGFLSAGSSCDKITKDTSFTGTTPDPATRFHKADKGVLRFFVDGSEVDNFDLESQFNEAEREGNQSYPPATSTNGYIKVTSVGWYNNFPLWQKGNATVQIGTSYGNSDLSTGDHTLMLRHELSSGNEDTNEDVIFVDNESARPGIASGPTVTEGTPQIKYLSGIQFYTQNSTFTVDVTTNDKIFEYTYVDTPLRLSMPGMNDVYVAYNDSSVSGVSDPPVYNEAMTVSSKQITLDQSNVCSDDGKLTATPRDPHGDGTAATESITDKRLINTYGNVSTNLIEQFQDEQYRLPQTWDFDDTSSTLTGNWDSTQVLSNGDAQVFNGKLIYPQTDFTSGYLPSQNTSADYSGFTGDQVYYRSFSQTGTPHNSGSIRLGGITWSDVSSGLIKVEIRLPNQTGWLDCSKDFNAATFTGADGDGCHTGHTESGGYLTINWSSGTFSTADSGYRYYIRITITSGASNKEITYLAEVGW